MSTNPELELSGVDINNDGRVDVAAHTSNSSASANDYALTIFANDGTAAAFTIGQSIDNVFNNYADNAYSASSMTWADYNQDGYLDLYLNRTTAGNASKIFFNQSGTLDSTGSTVGADTLAGSASVALDWNHDGNMDVIELTNGGVSGPVNLYTNLDGEGTSWSTTVLATAQAGVSGALAVDVDWDGDIDLVYTVNTSTSVSTVREIMNTNQVLNGSSLHLRILDQNGINTYYGNTVRLYDGQGNLISTQILNPQSGVGTNDSMGIVNFYNLDAGQNYSVELVRAAAGLQSTNSGTAGNITGINNTTWTGLVAGEATKAYVLSAETTGNTQDGNFAGTGYNDTFFGTSGNDSFNGAGGWNKPFTTAAPVWSATVGADIVDYSLSSSGITANLSAGTATGQGSDTFTSIEGLRGSALADNFTDSSADNYFEGRNGNDTFDLVNGGHDMIAFTLLDNGDVTGGNGSDTVSNFTIADISNANADMIDIYPLLGNYNGTANVYWDITTNKYVLDAASQGLSQFLNVTTGANPILQIDRDGAGAWVDLLTLTGPATDLATLIGNQQLSSVSAFSGKQVSVTAQKTLDTTPIVTGNISSALAVGETLDVVINGVTYSSTTGAVVVDPLNNTWYLQVPTALTAGTTYDVSAMIKATGSIVSQDRTISELVIATASVITIAGLGSAAVKATALTLGENGLWRIFSNDVVYDAIGTSSSSLGDFRSTTMSALGGEQTSSATFMDYNRDGYMDIFAADSSYGTGQTSYLYNGAAYTADRVQGGAGSASAIVYGWYGSTVAYDKTGDGFVDLVYGDATPNDNEAPGGYDTSYVVNTNGTMAGFIKDGNIVFTNTGTPAPTLTGVSTPDKQVSGVDIDNNGTVDIVYNDEQGSAATGYEGLRVARNIGDGTFDATSALPNVFIVEDTTNSNKESMTWADFDGDGDMDMFLARGRNAADTANVETSRIYLNTGTMLTSTGAVFLGDTLQGGASLALDWNVDGKMDIIELPRLDIGNTSNPINLYTNNGALSFTSTTLATVLAANDTTGALGLDLNWDGAKDLVYFSTTGVTGYVQNPNVVAAGTSLHVRIVDPQGINIYYGNTVQLVNSAGVVVNSQIINPQSGMQTNDSSALVDFYGLSSSETYSIVMLRNIGGGVGEDIGAVATVGGNTIEVQNSTWGGLKAGAATSAYVLTAEAATNNASTIGKGIVGTGYNDTFFATLGTDSFEGSGGSTVTSGVSAWSDTKGLDIVDFTLAGATPLTVNLSNTGAQATGFGTLTTFKNIEGIAGGSGADTFTDSAADNYFEGRDGNDTFNLTNGGHDTLIYKVLAADATGGNGADTVNGFFVGTYEATANADRIDLKSLLIGYTADSNGAAHYINGVATIDSGETITDYLSLTGNVLSIDRDGTGSTYSPTPIVTLTGTTTDLVTLLANHQIVV